MEQRETKPEWKRKFYIGKATPMYRDVFGWYEVGGGVWLSRNEEGVYLGGKIKGFTFHFYFWLPFYY